ncbi:MAG: PD-(D/E)XK nuclease family protein [Candidatus Methanomethylicaceae archaeon]|jgi:RecB family exonuclease
MATYSNSKLSTFEQCRYKYKLAYIERVEVETPNTIEAFLGNLVHRTLEKLYRDLKYQKMNSLNDLLAYYDKLWAKEWTDEIQITKSEYTKQNYKKMGEKFLSDYYNHYKPFDQMTVIGLETQEMLPLPDGNYYHIRIDRLGCKGDEYYVCDYKTSNRLKDQEEADDDRQLAMYSLWVKDKFKDAKKINLVWHMLAFDKEVVSERTHKQLEQLQQDVMERIKEIESCQNFTPNESALCDYCLYRERCPLFMHEVELEEKTVKEFKNDDGVKLVDRLAKLQELMSTANKEIQELRGELVEFALQKGLSRVYGSNKKASVKEYVRICFPEDKGELISLIREKGLYDELSMLNYPAISSRIAHDEIDQDIASLAKKENAYRITLSNRIVEEED